jgi:hypothetical protein
LWCKACIREFESKYNNSRDLKVGFIKPTFAATKKRNDYTDLRAVITTVSSTIRSYAATSGVAVTVDVAKSAITAPTVTTEKNDAPAATRIDSVRERMV